MSFDDVELADGGSIFVFGLSEGAEVFSFAGELLVLSSSVIAASRTFFPAAVVHVADFVSRCSDREDRCPAVFSEARSLTIRVGDLSDASACFTTVSAVGPDEEDVASGS